MIQQCVDPNFPITGVTSAIGSYIPGDNSFIEIKIPLSFRRFVIQQQMV
jgi:hypothetical protein